MGNQASRDETQLLIGGKWVEAGNGTYDIINPATEQVVGQAPNASVADAEAAAAAAREAFPGWAATPVEQRLALLKKAAAAIRAKGDDLVPLVIAETGATASVGSRMQVPVSAARFDRYSRDISHVQEHMLPPIVSEATPLAPGGLISALAYRQPVGVVTAIASYNFPMTNMAGKVAPALAMGNTVIMKPAPQDPLAVIEMARVLDEVGFPPGVVNIINSQGPEPATALTTTPDVDMVSFTGSTAVGQRIASAGAPTMKRLLMELGGKGGAVIFEDADIKGVVGAIGSVWAFHSGQICTAPTRAIVHRSIFDQVVAGLTQFAGVLKVGDPTEMSTVVGPVISAAQQQRIFDHIETARKEGEVVVGGGRPEHLDTGYYVEPTLVVGTNTITVAREEIFGPVVVAIPFDDEDEGIAIANDSEFGLYDYVFSKDTPGPSGWPSSYGRDTWASTPPSATWTLRSGASR